MLYFYHGYDYDKARAHARRIVDGLRTKKPDASVMRLDSFNYAASALDELVGSQGLFYNACIVDLRDVAETKEGKEEVLERLDAMAASPNVFVWTERDMDAKSVGIITKAAAEVKQYGTKPAKQERGSAVFDFVRLCAERNKKDAWVMYEAAIRGTYAAEEVSGSLFWQYKMITLAHLCGDAKEAGVSPYAFGNAKRLAAKVSLAEAQGKLFDVISMYHEAHRGKFELDAAMERFVLGI
jgi:hypothetical protein